MIELMINPCLCCVGHCWHRGVRWSMHATKLDNHCSIFCLSFSLSAIITTDLKEYITNQTLELEILWCAALFKASVCQLCLAFHSQFSWFCLVFNVQRACWISFWSFSGFLKKCLDEDQTFPWCDGGGVTEASCFAACSSVMVIFTLICFCSSWQ